MGINEIYDYLKNRLFIVTNEYRFKDGMREPCYRPSLGRITEVNLEKQEFTIKLIDYDEDTTYECTHPLPEYKDFTSKQKRNICWDEVSEHNGRDLVTRFWEA